MYLYQDHHYLLYHFSDEVLFNIHVLGPLMMLRVLQEMNYTHIVTMHIHHILLKPNFSAIFLNHRSSFTASTIAIYSVSMDYKATIC